LFWIPLGVAGSGFVRVVGEVYEAVHARRDHRDPLRLYHTALRVGTAEGVYTVEMMLPSPGGDTSSRGVVLVGSVGSAVLERLRPFRYEVRCWRDGLLFDREPGVVGPQRLSRGFGQAARLVELTGCIPISYGGATS
jgi:hypothetical protein